ncbi:helix-turn-helix transcriptional regulator [Wenyingzhuangia sp. 2_MG-2023]|uniref:helix-turn-helix domain-containing protein n=1 Tax=Wenyingzhuangia sp. 2_MG-2023 TaxID=3062639 RepID=UPI0026E1BDAA|nr:helix-turn-helix transcriptional regulator [Wenyingzhuangia sp. 2_MG-2023]MDO6737416.1 helix-turn-helix transcriptional regulator [Wenyingzhuangia sp. 2_MG-2023]MDO6803148.1 helix-turn-helix transcriptional regulator [Wenyingzhuangia sp. 1_MG-2023]
MLNNDDFITRLHKVFDYYNLTAATFADEIKVQRSSISHLLSGRNKPSLEFVLKMANTYKEITLDWLLYGKGSFPKKENEVIADLPPKKNPQNLFSSTEPAAEQSVQQKETVWDEDKKITTPSSIERIVIFYKNGTFKEYTNP